MNENAHNWEANFFRMIAFSEKSLLGKEREQWDLIFEEDPEVMQCTKTTGVVAGPKENTQFEIEIDPVRLKITQSAIIDFEKITSAFPSVGDFYSARKTFDEIVKKWLSTRPAITRLAFVSNVALLTNSTEESYKFLSEFLNYPRIESAREFSLQLNRRRNSTVIDNEINRLVRWRAATMSVKGEYKQNAGISRDVNLVEDQTLVTMELDINSVPLEEGCILPAEKLTDLYCELVNLAEELVKSGDID